MSLASDLMGFGLPPLLSEHIASGGNGPLSITAAGSAFSSATRIQANQYVVSCTNANGTNGLSLPVVGGDGGCLLADDFVVNNANGSNALNLFSSSGVAISVGGTNTSSTTIASHTTMTLYAITTTQWVGVKGS